MDNKGIKTITGLLLIAITIFGLIVVADITKNKTLSRVEVIETPRYEVELGGGFIVDPYYTDNDQGTNQTVATSDGGWITTSVSRNRKEFERVIKYDALGNVEWSKDYNVTVSGTGATIYYYDNSDRVEKVFLNEYTDGIGTSQIMEASDGTGYFVTLNDYINVIFKIDKEGNYLWKTDTSYYHQDRTFMASCPYDGNTNSEGQVRYFGWNSNTGELTPYDWYEDLKDYMKRDDSTYYCGQVYGDYYNYVYLGNGRMTAMHDGGVAFLTKLSSVGDQYHIRYDDGTQITPTHGKTIFFYDKNGKLYDSLDVVQAYQDAEAAWKAKYGITGNMPNSYKLINDTYVYHDYIGFYPNGDILLVMNPGTAAVKLRKNATTGKYEPIWFVPMSVNGQPIQNMYSNGDGELPVQLLDDGGFVIKPQQNSYFSRYATKYDYWNTPINQIQLFDYQYHEDSDVDNLTNASWLFHFGERTDASGNKEGYLQDMVPFATTWRSNNEADWERNGDLTRLFWDQAGSSYYRMDDGSYIVSLYYGQYVTYSEYFRKVQLANGEIVNFDPPATFLVYRVTQDGKIQWLKQYSGISNRHNQHPKMRISADKKHLLIPVEIAANSTITELGNTNIPVIQNTTSSNQKGFLVFNLLYDREERIIPDPVTTTESTTKGKTTTSKKTTKKTTGEVTTTEEVTTEPTTEETTETTTTTTTSKKTTTKAAEVKGEETKKKVDVKKIVTIVGISFVGLFTGGFTFYFIPFVIIPRRKRVLVAMSGGPASAVAAKKLLDKHYKVYGLFISNSSNLQAFSNAKQIANKLEIDLFEQEINDVYRAKLSEGIAANPNTDLDKIYNKYILLEALKDVAKEQHIKYIATGHYATKKSGSIQAGVNQVFDESDKLSLLTSDDIKKLLLPIGELDYQEVTKIAEANNINLTNTKQTPEEKIGSTNITK